MEQLEYLPGLLAKSESPDSMESSTHTADINRSTAYAE